MRYASTFDGIGGFQIGFGPTWANTAMCEIDPQARRVLSAAFPTVPLLGDIRDVRGTDLGSPDLLVGGFPCQDTSIAAPHRTGLEGSRSGMFWEFRRVLAEQLRLVDESRPRWVVIENTPGLLTTNRGRDMATVLGALVELGYGVSFRVVDGRRLGTRQRRPRVLMVGHRSGDPRVSWAVLGDTSAGSETPAAYRVGREQGGPRPVGSAQTADGVTIWRKSARPRAAISKGGYETWVTAEHANTLTGFDGGLATRQTHLLLDGGRLRTFTLTEWERLQGFPDGWTAPMTSDAARFTALGNAIHTGTASWLARRIESHDVATLVA